MGSGYLFCLARVATVSAVVLLAYSVSTKAADSQTNARDQGSHDVSTILAWLTGSCESDSFKEPFGDGGFIARATNVLFYTDVDNVTLPKEFTRVPYDHIKARIEMITAGHRLPPAVLIARSVADEPEGGMGARVATREAAIPKLNRRYYYVEVAIGNMATHWMKVFMGEVDGKRVAFVGWHGRS